MRHLHLKGAVSVVKSLAAELMQRMANSYRTASFPPGSMTNGTTTARVRVRVAVTGGGGRTLTEALARELSEYEPVYDPLLVHRGLHTAWMLRL